MHKIQMRPFNITRAANHHQPNEENAVIQLNDRDCGILINRLTTVERDGITPVKDGLLLYNIDAERFEYSNNGYWMTIQIVQTEVELFATMGVLNWDIEHFPVARIVATENLTINVVGGYTACVARLGIIQGIGAPYDIIVTGVTQKGTTVWETAEGGINILTIDMIGSTRIATIL